jgi:hypothetical protein
MSERVNDAPVTTLLFMACHSIPRMLLQLTATMTMPMPMCTTPASFTRSVALPTAASTVLVGRQKAPDFGNIIKNCNEMTRPAPASSGPFFCHHQAAT